MVTCIDLNADLGEGYGVYSLGFDDELMPVISSANIACGLHAGDPVIMGRTVEMAVSSNTAVGAHVSYPDIWGFGRRHVELTEKELHRFLLYQLGSINAFVRAENTTLQHVKPHGALYNEAATCEALSQIICDAISDFDRGLMLYAPANSITSELAREKGLRVVEEGFADRAYSTDGTLVPRDQPGAVLDDAEKIAKRVCKMADGHVSTADGEELYIDIDTICVHGDTPDALKIARLIRSQLEAEDIEICPPIQF